jgi:hypothetical protein
MESKIRSFVFKILHRLKGEGYPVLNSKLRPTMGKRKPITLTRERSLRQRLQNLSQNVGAFAAL